MSDGDPFEVVRDALVRVADGVRDVEIADPDVDAAIRTLLGALAIANAGPRDFDVLQSIAESLESTANVIGDQLPSLATMLRETAELVWNLPGM